MDSQALRAFIVGLKGTYYPESAYTLTNVTGTSGQDVFTYRLRFKKPVSSTEVLKIFLAHANPEDQTMEGRPEMTLFMDGCAQAIPDDKIVHHHISGTSFTHTPAYDIVFSAGPEYGKCFTDLYFTIADEDITPILPPPPGPKKAGAIDHRDQTHAPGVKPKWNISVETGMLCAQEGLAEWCPLAPVHPDPNVDPGVSVHLCPQGMPRWLYYRSVMDSPNPHNINLGGKLSGTKWWPLLGEFSAYGFPDRRDKGFKGNALTRRGRLLEMDVAMCMLNWHNKTNKNFTSEEERISISECGSFPHPTISDAMASPDGIIFMPKRAASNLPKWFRDKLIHHAFDGDESALEKIDFRRGVWECKTGDGSFKDRYLPQLYAEMICADTYWAELTTLNPETKEIRLYRVYRDPYISALFDAVIARMREELLKGTPFAKAVDHPQNRELIAECKKQAKVYNETKGLFYVIPYEGELISKLAALSNLYAAPVSLETTAEGKTIEEMHQERLALLAPASKKKKKKTTANSGAATPTKRERASPKEPKAPRAKLHKPAMQIWDEVLGTTNRIDKLMRSGEWETVLAKEEIGRQLLRYFNLQSELSSARAIVNHTGDAPGAVKDLEEILGMSIKVNDDEPQQEMALGQDDDEEKVPEDMTIPFAGDISMYDEGVYAPEPDQ